MGKVISRNSSTERIVESANRALTRAKAVGGDVQALAEGRLGATMVAIVANEQQLNQAREHDDVLHAALMAKDNESDLEIGAICDEIWNAMGRPMQSVDYDLIMAGGKRAWTEVDPAKQAVLMSVLSSNIRGSKHPKLADKKEGWAKRIDDKATAQAEAAAPTEASHAQVMVLSMQRRTLADSAQVALTRLKRDLKNNGMTESQIHEIIPDIPSSSKPATPAAQTTTPQTTS